jgi:hypothetical protein
MGITPLRRLNQFSHNVLGRSLIRITHAEIYDILTTCSGCRLKFIDDGEDIRRQTLNPWKFYVQVKSPKFKWNSL